MKLLNYTSSYFSIILLIIIPVWAGLFYFAMLDEIYDSMDDGLGNQKLLVINRVAQYPALLNKRDFQEGNYAIQPISFGQAKDHKDLYSDTLMYMQNENDFEPVRMLKTVFTHQGQYYSMRLITSMVEEDDLVFSLFTALIWLYLGLVITIILLNNLLLQRIWRPFNRLIDQLGSFKLEKSKPLQHTDTKIDEFNMLNSAVDKMLKTNIETFNSQKQFIENASHELQTPLAVTFNKLERLAETGELTSQQAELLSSAIDSLIRLKRLNQSLLLLSKIDNNQYADTQTVNVNLIAHRIVEDSEDLASYKQVEIVVEANDTCLWNLHPDLANILLSNLIMNAIKYNIPGGKVWVIIDKKTLTVKNNGVDRPLNEKRIFDRFYKEQESENSTGLGLAIVKAIANHFGIAVNYRYNSEHTFKLSQ